MGLAGASNSAVTGLQSQSTNIAITSDNIANASTTGYKSVKGVFSTLVTSAGSSNSYSSGGVSITPQTLVDQQGLIETTGNATDLAISGSGFFAVQDSSGTLLLTRAGSFTVNNKGILTNAAGFSLLGWPLDSNGLLPGASGNSNTTAAESTDSLVPVDTNSASGAASATTTVKTGINLNASQATFQGATVTITPSSSNNNSVAKGDILLPATGMQQGDQFTFTPSSLTEGYTFEYGGYAKSKNIGDSTLYGVTSSTTTFSTSDGDLTEGDKFSITTSASGTVTFKFVQSSPNTSNGEFNSLATLATAINAANGLTARTDGTSLYISSDIATQAITFADVTTDCDMVAELGLSNVAAASTGVNRFNTISGLSVLVNAQDELGSVIYDPTAGATLDIFASDPLQTLTFTKVMNTATINLQSDNNGVNTPSTMIVPTEVDATVTSTMIPDVLGTDNGTGGSSAATLSFTDGTNTGTFTYGGIGSSNAISSTNTIFGASTVDGLFDSTAASTAGLDTGDTITFSDGTTTCTVTYSTTVPLPTTSSFNSLSSLASAINVASTAAGSTVYARVANDTLYIASNSSANANKAISITNTSGITGAQIKAALGGDFGATSTGATTASIVAAVSTGNSRFSNLTQLNNLISGITDFSTTTPVGSNCSIPITTDSDTQLTIGGSDNAMLLEELGIAAGGVGDGFFDEMGVASIFSANLPSTSTTDAVLAITYDPNDISLNMAGGNITPDFSRNIRMFDALGTGHNFTLAFLKTGTNEWATEFYPTDPLDISNDDDSGSGLLVSGTIKFNGDGSLKSVDSALTEDITIDWTGGSTPTTFNFSLGTAGQPSGTSGASVIGLTDGLRQFDSAYNVDFVQQNGVAAGQFGGLEVSEDGTISAKFSNGQVKAIYKLPIVLVPNQNGLFQKTGNVFAITQASGDVNLKQAGIGGSGVIVPEALEGSTADIASELTKTISIQANYNANATLISTVKSMEDELNRRL